ncbi:putative TPR-repeat-containing chaperone protein DNAJ [Trypanosoma conorhini]|uniref:Putative TPR-repeat-containing chaperone protein DNAJ n=1 Tax=Trypanosoma conorhini TaxID=83891 RepID=A0A3R7L0H4_9TRYP|nr:putative TPR-repeat-containing chaperone protein DNAJ [Trypanosoma conorhini]RNF17190.1 putative TPR-repeat-containing chaperone protein DNAJ [Trypanosoma conorhini]
MSSETGEALPPLDELREAGNNAFKAGNFDVAIAHYTQAIEANPQEVALFSNRSAAHFKKGDFEAAAQDAAAAIAVDKTFAKSYSRLHNAYCNLGRFQEAAQRLNEGIEALKASGASKEEIRHLRELCLDAEAGRKAVDDGRRFLENRDFAAAERSLASTARSFPDCATIAFMFGEALAPRQPEEANRILVRFTRAHAQDTYYLYVRALASYYRGPDGFKAAQNILRQALELDPDNRKVSALLKKIRVIEFHKECGNTAYKGKRYRDAINAYTSALGIDATNLRTLATLRANQAAAKMELKEYSDALLDCDFAVNNGLSTAKLFARRARIHEALNNYDDALRDIQKATEMDASYEGEFQRTKASAKRAKRKDYYKVLDLPPNENDDAQIKRAYKKACLQWHPDKWAHASQEEKTHAEKMFKEVGEAFSILSDPQKKRMYDNGMLDNAVEGASGTGFSGFAGQDEVLMHMMNRMFFTGGGGRWGLASTAPLRDVVSSSSRMGSHSSFSNLV